MSLIQQFVQEISVRQAAQHLGLSYNTAYKAITTIRLSVVAHSPGCERWLGRLERSRTSGVLGAWKLEAGAPSPPVFGVRKVGRKVQIEPVDEVGSKDVLALEVKKIRRGKLVYTDPVGDFASLFFYGHEPGREDEVVFAKNRYHHELHDFWRFASQRIRAGLNPEKFPLHMKEIEFRFNHRDDESMEDEIVQFMCDFVNGYSELGG